MHPSETIISRIAIVDHNTLAVIGLKQMLMQVKEGIQVDVFYDVQQLNEAGPDRYFHFFVSSKVLFENRLFFLEHRRKTIVLCQTQGQQFDGFHSLPVDTSEELFTKQLLLMMSHAHRRLNQPNSTDETKVFCHKQLPVPNVNTTSNLLSGREIEVMALVAQGRTNKEIADQLNIALTTVISHRKNICDKLQIKTVSALTIYAVMNGYVTLEQI